MNNCLSLKNIPCYYHVYYYSFNIPHDNSYLRWLSDPLFLIHTTHPSTPLWDVSGPNGTLFPPYIVNWFCPEPYGPLSKVVHYKGNRVPFQTHPVFHLYSVCSMGLVQADWDAVLRRCVTQTLLDRSLHHTVNRQPTKHHILLQWPLSVSKLERWGEYPSQSLHWLEIWVVTSRKKMKWNGLRYYLN
jgi:hypothetical protein